MKGYLPFKNKIGGQSSSQGSVWVEIPKHWYCSRHQPASPSTPPPTHTTISPAQFKFPSTHQQLYANQRMPAHSTKLFKEKLVKREIRKKGRTTYHLRIK